MTRTLTSGAGPRIGREVDLHQPKVASGTVDAEPLLAATAA
jgi:hypothetical protein